MTTRPGDNKKGGIGEFMGTQNTSATQPSSAAPSTSAPVLGASAPAPTAASSTASATAKTEKKENTGIFSQLGNMFAAEEKTATKDISSLGSVAPTTSATEKTKRAAPCKSIRDQVLERAIAIEAEITSAQNQLTGLIKLVKADTNNPTGRSEKSSDSIIPGLKDLNPFSGGGKKKRHRKKTRGRKKTMKHKKKHTRRR